MFFALGGAAAQGKKRRRANTRFSSGFPVVRGFRSECLFSLPENWTRFKTEEQRHTMEIDECNNG